MKLNTVTKKTMLLISAIGVVVLLIINMLLPAIFYEVMRPHLINHISSVVNSSSLRLSYIWKSNNTLHQIRFSDEVKALVSAYYRKDADKDAIREQLLPYLPTVTNGISKDDPSVGDQGYIVSTNYFMLFTSEGDLFYNNEAQRTARVLEESDWYQSFDRLQYDENNEFFEHLPVIEDPHDPNFRISCKVASFQVGDITCFCVNAINLDDILAQFSEFEEFGIDDYLTYAQGKVLYRSLGNRSNIDLDQYPAYMFEGRQYEPMIWTDGNETNLMVLCTYTREDYHVAVNIPKDTLLAPYEEAFQYFRLLLGGIVVILLILFCVTLKGTLNRLTRLDKKMKRVRGGDYDVTVHDTSTDEIGSLANTFNTMLDRIKHDMEKEQQMQYSLMVSAIDPHYIYNTLNTVTALAELGRNEDVVAVNDALIATLKDRLKMKNYKTFDTVDNERRALEQYMVIQNYLFYQKMELVFRVSEQDLEMQIPKNILQPLVENAIKHGILCNEDANGDPIPGVIRVSVTREELSINIEVADNGIGMDQQTIQRFFLAGQEQAAPEKSMEHIGVYNVQMRLNYLYRNEYDFQVESHVGFGTKINIVLPCRDSDEHPASL